jgi:hypothetical protein
MAPRIAGAIVSPGFVLIQKDGQPIACEAMVDEAGKSLLDVGSPVIYENLVWCRRWRCLWHLLHIDPMEDERNASRARETKIDEATMRI